MNVLVTGGAGYIRNHIYVELHENGHEVIAIDDLSNSKKESLHQAQLRAVKKSAVSIADLINSDILQSIFKKLSIDSVIHYKTLYKFHKQRPGEAVLSIHTRDGKEGI